MCDSMLLTLLKNVTPGAYAAFSAGGGGVHFKLERNSCQQSLNYISLYNTKGAPFLLRKEMSFCVRKIRNIILTMVLPI